LQKLGAYRLFLILAAVEAMAYSLIFTVNLVYQVEQVKLSPLQLVLVGTALEITVFLFEIPTGIVADVYSRRLSVIISMALTGLAFFVETSIPVFAAVVIGQALWGLAYTFTSGARNAWLADEIGEEPAAKAYLRASQVASVFSLIGIALAVALGSISLTLSIRIGASVFIALGLFLIAFMPETGFKPVPRGERTSWAHMADTFRAGWGVIRVRPALITMMLVLFFYGAASEGLDRLWTAHLIRDFSLPSLGPLEPVAWFGLIRASGMLLSIGPAEYLHRRLETTNLRVLTWALMGIDAAVMAALAVFALAGNFTAALIAILIISPLRALIGPLETSWVNRGLESNSRATVLSMSEQAGALGELSGGPVLGAIGSAQSIRAALVGSTLLMGPVIGLFGRSLVRNEHREVVVVAEGE
jgi:MFS transporter, DHA3 family, tetracycline resistance protein